MPIEPNIKQGYEIQTKFEFYVLALVFTLLALSIQTAQFTSAYFQFYFEILGWICLLVSGLAGLSRMEWIPIAYMHMGTKNEDEKFLKEINLSREKLAVNPRGELLAQDELHAHIENLTNKIEKRDVKIKNLNQHNKKTYAIHKWAFVAGIILLIISRGLFHCATMACDK